MREWLVKKSVQVTYKTIDSSQELGKKPNSQADGESEMIIQ